MTHFTTSPTTQIEALNLDGDAPRAATKALDRVEKLNREAEVRWAPRLRVDNSLTRALVSFQANKGRAVYRWFKYKEAFSAGLVEHLLSRYRIAGGIVLDPFAGSGTALFAAGGLGMKAEGIELLPIGQIIITTKQLIDWQLTDVDVDRLAFWRDKRPWRQNKASKAILDAVTSSCSALMHTSPSMRPCSNSSAGKHSETEEYVTDSTGVHQCMAAKDSNSITRGFSGGATSLSVLATAELYSTSASHMT